MMIAQCFSNNDSDSYVGDDGFDDIDDDYAIDDEEMLRKRIRRASLRADVVTLALYLGILGQPQAPKGFPCSMNG